MRVEPINIEARSKFLKDYLNENEHLYNNFDYFPYQENCFKQRVKDIRERNFDRASLVNTLRTLNEAWGAGAETLSNINLLEKENSLVVIGGQQAGLLSGPLYTIHKIISIIQLAKKQTKELNIPVIPVFWIAGEDHDFEEINHIYVEKRNHLKKHKINQPFFEKKPVSSCPIDQDYARRWLKEVFYTFEETAYTKDFYKLAEDALKDSETYADFFARIITRLFQKEGLVLVDSGSPAIRKMESSFFTKIIKHQPKISNGVFHAFQRMQNSGYNVSVEVDKDDGHLFYHLNGERVLLVRDGENWLGKQGECSFSTQELLDIAKNNPELLSNNVVTRPLMQECLFPTLVFLGGPSEVAYWSILKPAFQAFDLKMPPVLPRVSISLIDEQVNRILTTYQFNVTDVVRSGTSAFKLNWLQTQQDPPIGEMVEQVKQSLDRIHQPVREVAKDLRADMGTLAEKNLEHLNDNLDFLQKKMEAALRDKYQIPIKAFDLVGERLHPYDGLQERCFNIFYFLNKYGDSWLEELVNQDYDYEAEHYVAFL